MKCNIEYVGKKRSGKPQYYCTVHKEYASDAKGNKLDECLCKYKELFNNCLDIKNNDIKDIKIIIPNILNYDIPELLINNQEFKGVLKYEDSILSHKDFLGIMLAKLNNIPLEKVKCNHCGKFHSDNGKFAYTPHKIHLCLYCGHLFHAKNKNVGSELEMIYQVPKIKLENKLIKVDNILSLEYDFFKGELLLNKQSCNRILLNEKEIDVVEFLNQILELEY